VLVEEAGKPNLSPAEASPNYPIECPYTSGLL